MKNLAELDSEYKIEAGQIKQFQRDGHILLRNVCSKEEIEGYHNYIRNIVLEHAKTRQDLSKRDTYGKAFLQVGNIWTRHDVVKKFVFARRLARIAAQLSLAGSMRLYHEQALFKESGGGITPWHQDQFYWPLGTNQAITMWMPLVDVSQEMGSMGFASGSHKNGYLGNIPISDESENYFKDYILNKGFTISQSGEMQAGDATFHNGWTLHGAAPNKSSQMREVMTIIYYPDGTKLIKPESVNQQADFDAFFSGLNPGQAAASKLTPIVYNGV